MPRMTSAFGVCSVVLIFVIAVNSNDQSVVRLTVCPKKFIAIGRKCYHFGKEEITWQDAHFKCLNLNSTLAVVTRSHQELLIRQYLNRHTNALGKYERWIGGTFNWKQAKWIWGVSGKPLEFQGFSRMNPNLKDKWKWNCIIIDPLVHNKWSARSCIQKKRFLCQAAATKFVAVNPKEDVCHDPQLTPHERTRCLNRKTDPSVPEYLVKKKKKPQTFKDKDFICPSHMILVGRKCYYFSTEAVSWSDAHYACLDNKTRLAVVNTKMQDNILRGFLNENFVGESKHERWIGGMFDSRQHKWKWAMKGIPVKYQNFAAAVANTDNTYNCITVDPVYNNQWNSKPRFQEKHYICQVKPQVVIKYGKAKHKIRRPDATVVIKFDNSYNNIVIKSLNNSAATTEIYPYYKPYFNNSSSTEQYLHN